MSSKRKDDSTGSKTKSLKTDQDSEQTSFVEDNSELFEQAILIAKEAIVASNRVSERMASPWKGWSFIYKLMFILGITLILVLSCLLPVLILQQVNSSNTQIETNTDLLDKTAKDDKEIVTNQQIIIASNAYRVLLQENICKAIPGCVIPPAPNTDPDKDGQ